MTNVRRNPINSNLDMDYKTLTLNNYFIEKGNSSRLWVGYIESDPSIEFPTCCIRMDGKLNYDIGIEFKIGIDNLNTIYPFKDLFDKESTSYQKLNKYFKKLEKTPSFCKSFKNVTFLEKHPNKINKSSKTVVVFNKGELSFYPSNSPSFVVVIKSKISMKSLFTKIYTNLAELLIEENKTSTEVVKPKSTKPKAKVDTSHKLKVNSKDKPLSPVKKDVEKSLEEKPQLGVIDIKEIVTAFERVMLNTQNMLSQIITLISGIEKTLSTHVKYPNNHTGFSRDNVVTGLASSKETIDSMENRYELDEPSFNSKFKFINADLTHNYVSFLFCDRIYIQSSSKDGKFGIITFGLDQLYSFLDAAKRAFDYAKIEYRCPTDISSFLRYSLEQNGMPGEVSGIIPCNSEFLKFLLETFDILEKVLK